MVIVNMSKSSFEQYLADRLVDSTPSSLGAEKPQNLKGSSSANSKTPTYYQHGPSSSSKECSSVLRSTLPLPQNMPPFIKKSSPKPNEAIKGLLSKSWSSRPANVKTDDTNHRSLFFNPRNESLGLHGDPTNHKQVPENRFSSNFLSKLPQLPLPSKPPHLPPPSYFPNSSNAIPVQTDSITKNNKHIFPTPFNAAGTALQYSNRINAYPERSVAISIDARKAIDHRIVKSESFGRNDNFENRSAGAQKKQVYIIDELKETEKTYVHDIKVLFTSFATPLCEYELFWSPEIKSISHTIQSLFTFQHSFQFSLCNARDPETVANLFIKYAKGFDIYIEYCTKYHRLCDILDNFTSLDSSSVWVSFLTEAQTHLNHNADKRRLCLRDFLIKPIQRICKYPLFLKDLMKNTSADQASYPSLSHALVLIRNVCRCIDDEQRRNEAQKLRNTIIANYCDSPELPIMLVSRLGNVLLSGPLRIAAYNKGSIQTPKMYGCIMFKRFLIIVKLKKTGIIVPTFWFPLHTMVLINSMDDQTIAQFAQHDERHWLVRHKKSGKCLIFFARCAPERDVWVERFQQAIEDSREHVKSQEGNIGDERSYTSNSSEYAKQADCLDPAQGNASHATGAAGAQQGTSAGVEGQDYLDGSKCSSQSAPDSPNQMSSPDPHKRPNKKISDPGRLLLWHQSLLPQPNDSIIERRFEKMTSPELLRYSTLHKLRGSQHKSSPKISGLSPDNKLHSKQPEISSKPSIPQSDKPNRHKKDEARTPRLSFKGPNAQPSISAAVSDSTSESDTDTDVESTSSNGSTCIGMANTSYTPNKKLNDFIRLQTLEPNTPLKVLQADEKAGRAFGGLDGQKLVDTFSVRQAAEKTAKCSYAYSSRRQLASSPETAKSTISSRFISAIGNLSLGRRRPIYDDMFEYHQKMAAHENACNTPNGRSIKDRLPAIAPASHSFLRSRGSFDDYIAPTDGTFKVKRTKAQSFCHS